MSARTRVGLELVDSVLRYAALEQEEDAHRLLRLGRCDFEFDAAAWLHEEDAPSRLDTIAGAIEEVLDGIDAIHFHLVVHPPTCTIFTAPVPTDTTPAERNERLHWEAGQLMGVDEQTFKIIVHPLRSEPTGEGTSIDWFYVMALRRTVYENLVSMLGQARERVVPHFSGSVQAATAVAEQASEAVSEADKSYPASRLLVGQYGDRVEYAFSNTSRGATSCYWEGGSASDASYAIARLAETAGEDITAIDEVLLYGSSPHEKVLSEVMKLTGKEPRRFNPFEALKVDTGQVSDEFSYWEYVPSVGVTL